MKKHLKYEAIKLRQKGWSYNIISARLNVAKSTLSDWLKETPYVPNEEVRQRIGEGPAKSGAISHNKKMEVISSIRLQAAKELGVFTERDIWMLGIGLYIGEGAKLYESIRIINSDPNVIRLAMRWFRNVCKLSENNFTVAIHLYPDTSIKESLFFWSKITGVPISQFGKTQIDKRANKSWKKKRKLPYGTAHITVKSCGKKEFGVTLHRRIMGWIEHVYKENAGIV